MASIHLPFKQCSFHLSSFFFSISPLIISSIQLLVKQRSFHLSSLYLAKNYFINPASNKQLNNIFVLFGTNSSWDESSRDETSIHHISIHPCTFITLGLPSTPILHPSLYLFYGIPQ